MTMKAPLSPRAAARQDLGSLKPVRVWDLPTRLFHWVLVLLIGGLWWTGENSAVPLGPVGGASLLGWTVPTGQMAQHMTLGYAVLALVIWRVLYGLFGSTTARFASFVKGPADVMRYLRQSFAARKETAAYVLGHNPAGGWMILALLVILAAQAITGLFANDDIFTEGPLFSLVSKETSDSLTAWHKNILFPALLALIGLHVAAALFYLVVKGENLIRAMVTGRKQAPADAGEALRFASPLVALAAIAVAAGAVWAVVTQV